MSSVRTGQRIIGQCILILGVGCGAGTLEAQDHSLVPVTGKSEVRSGHDRGRLPAPVLLQNSDAEQDPVLENITGEPSSSSPGTRETIIQRYSDGQPQIERQVTQDAAGNYLNDGTWKLFSRQGEVMAKGTFDQGRMDGAWQRWHPVDATGIFRESPFDRFPGPYLSVAQFTQGKLHGTWTLYDRNRRKIFEMPYHEGQRHGRAVWYSPQNTVVREVDFVNGDLHGKWIDYNRQNEIARQSTWVEGQEIIRRIEYYHRNQKRSEKHYLGPRIEFVTRDDWWNAEMAHFESVGEERLHGSTTEWYANGQVRLKGQYQEGLRVGPFRWWHENGQKQIEGAFDRDLKTGLWTWWHANGMKAVEGEFQEGVERGRWRWWDDQGNLLDERNFTDEQSLEGIEVIDPNLPDLEEIGT